MVRYRRNFVPGGTYFFTVTLADRTSLALVQHVDALRKAFRIARHERPFTVEAIVILPEHLHAIWTLPADDSDFSGRWRRIKAYFSHRLAAAGVPIMRHRNGEYALWQRRFWEHTIRNETDFERHVDYVHFNPVKHELVTRVCEWPYSSFHVYVRRGILPMDWGWRCRTTASGFRRATGLIADFAPLHAGSRLRRPRNYAAGFLANRSHCTAEGYEAILCLHPLVGHLRRTGLIQDFAALHPGYGFGG